MKQFVVDLSVGGISVSTANDSGEPDDTMQIILEIDIALKFCEEETMYFSFQIDIYDVKF